MAILGKSIYKSADQLRSMVEPGRITAAALAAVRAAIRPGVTTLELDAIAERVIREAGAAPNFMLEPGYTHTICASVNDDVVHGIPNERPLEPGDLVSIDCGAVYRGWNGDAAISMVIPDPDRAALVAAREALSSVTEQSLWAGIAALASVRHLNAVGAAIEEYIERHEPGDAPYGLLEEYVGHGIGRSMHEDPPVFNYRVRGAGPAVKAGLVIAIEPMVTAGGIETYTRDDDWTVATSDGAPAAHWEHSIAVHAKGVWVLTAEDGGVAGLKPFGVTPVPIP